MPGRDTHAASKTAEKVSAKEYLRFTREDILWPLVFLLSLSMVGLHFPLGYLLAPVILISRFKKDKYDFMIMLMFMLYGYSFYNTEDIYFKTQDLAAIVALVCLVIVKKPPLFKKIIAGIAIYALCLFILASLSDEPMISQIYGPRNHLLISILFLPIVIFSGEEFNIFELFRHLFVYMFIICCFYIIDSVLLGGYLLIPKSLAGWGESSTFYSLNINPISNAFFRRTIHTLFILALCVYPMAKYYKLSTLYWIVFLLSLYITRTFSVIVAFVIVYFLSQGNFKKIGKYAVICVLTFTVLYFVDGLITGNKKVEEYENGLTYTSSVLRIKSHVDQIGQLLSGNLDEETAAALGSTRGAQVIPKMQHLYDLDKEWTGFGFLDRFRTTNQKYIIENELYIDVSNSEEVAVGVEVIVFEIILTIGYIGLIIHILFYVYLWWIIRKFKFSGYFLSVAGFYVIAGFGGFGGLIEPYALTMAGIAYGSVLLMNKDKIFTHSRTKGRLRRIPADEDNKELD